MFLLLKRYHRDCLKSTKYLLIAVLNKKYLDKFAIMSYKQTKAIDCTIAQKI